MNNQGLSLIEILIAIVVSTVVVAAMFFTYNTFQNSYRGVLDRSIISKNARTALTMISKDIRMAGFRDFNSKDNFSDQVIILNDSSNGPDSIEVTYDYNVDERIRVGYKLEKENNNKFYHLSKSRKVWDGSKWSTSSTLGAYDYDKVLDYIMDLQFVLRDKKNLRLNSNQSDQAQTVEIFLIVRSPNKISKLKTVTLQSDNRNIICEDNYHCEDFFVSVYPRNIIKN